MMSFGSYVALLCKGRYVALWSMLETLIGYVALWSKRDSLSGYVALWSKQLYTTPLYTTSNTTLTTLLVVLRRDFGYVVLSVMWLSEAQFVMWLSAAKQSSLQLWWGVLSVMWLSEAQFVMWLSEATFNFTQHHFTQHPTQHSQHHLLCRVGD